MTIEEMKTRKAELGYTNDDVSRLSGVPLGTVQKIFAGETRAPRYDTIQKLKKVLQPAAEEYAYEAGEGAAMLYEANTFLEYGRHSRLNRVHSAQTGENLKPPKKKIGIADGKFRMPSDELLLSDETADMFEDL